jgi:hypothetical protein
MFRKLLHFLFLPELQHQKSDGKLRVQAKMIIFTSIGKERKETVDEKHIGMVLVPHTWFDLSVNENPIPTHL